MWWEGVKNDSVQLRGKHGCKHWTKGPHPEWEDVLVLALGLDWRTFRDGFADEAAWQSESVRFINVVCERWGLPMLTCMPVPNTLRILDPPQKRARLTPWLLENVPDNLALNVDLGWHGSRQRFVFVVDCKPVQEVTCGVIKLSDCELTSIFELSGGQGSTTKLPIILQTTRWTQNRLGPVAWSGPFQTKF